MTSERYRIAQWGTGHTGLNSLRSIIEHPEFDLVGVRVYSDDKVGRDAGELCGIEPTGIVATRDIGEILAARPDCVMYMPLLDHHSIDDMCRILEAGSNIVTTVTGFPHAPSIEPGIRARLEAACAAGNTSLYGTGSCPGFITEVVPLALLVMERRFENLKISQFADVSTRKSPKFLRTLYGIDPADANTADGAVRSTDADGFALRQVADAINLPIDRVEGTCEVAVSTKDVEIDVMTVPAGTVGAWRQDIVAYRDDKPLLEYTRIKYAVKDLEPAWEILNTGWHVSVRGDVPLEMDLRFATQSYGSWSAGINANLPINSVTSVIQARSGILSTAELPLIPNFGA